LSLQPSFFDGVAKIPPYGVRVLRSLKNLPYPRNTLKLSNHDLLSVISVDRLSLIILLLRVKMWIFYTPSMNSVVKTLGLDKLST